MPRSLPELCLCSASTCLPGPGLRPCGPCTGVRPAGRQTPAAGSGAGPGAVSQPPGGHRGSAAAAPGPARQSCGWLRCCEHGDFFFAYFFFNKRENLLPLLQVLENCKRAEKLSFSPTQNNLFPLLKDFIWKENSDQHKMFSA